MIGNAVISFVGRELNRTREVRAVEVELLKTGGGKSG
jgi:hypothetical protein